MINGAEENGEDNNDDSDNSSRQDAADLNVDDPVVHEIPVFLAKSLANQLFLIQYPVRPRNVPYDASTSSVISSRFKREHQQVELTLALNTNCANYDKSKGEQIALNVDGNGDKQNEDEVKTFPYGVMDRQVLSSSKAIKDPSRYAVGILDANELHLTPLQGILSVKPSLVYLDKSDKTAKAEGRPSLLDTSQDEDEDGVRGDEDDVQRVGVRFMKAGSDADKVQKKREKSFEYQQRMAREEPWLDTQFHPVKSKNWQEVSQKLFCKRMDDESFSAVSSSAEANKAQVYLDKLQS